MLSKSTTETFQQGPDKTTANGDSNCFNCHGSSSNVIATTAVSHIFKNLKPLF
jgi:hypothetical protein